ncbi:MAG: T9SS type A sorting domain-containing protein [candidate division Zixibacteria bacterium]|nr:T9SS type A sorting domain-containing protein [candidate division Zixibacteria bacterium]
MTKCLIFMVLTVIMIIAVPGAALAQWPDNADSNLVINDQSGAQAIPKVATTSDGGCFVSWYNNSSGNYDMYMQYLNADGVVQWERNGQLISDHPQATWLTDYSMTVDHEDHAIITFNDTRAGEDWDIYAYRISPLGDFAWGDDGLTLSANNGFEPYPQVTVTSSGNMVFAWQEENMIHIRKVNPAGEDMWDPATITLTSTHGLSIPRIVSAENDGVILQVLDAAGPNYWDPKHIYVHKFDSLGAALWGENGVAVSTAGGIGIQMFPNLADDGNGGSYSYWYDTRTMDHHVYVQHVTVSGEAEWTANGVQTCLAGGQLQMSPALARLGETGDVLVFYNFTNSSQSQVGLQGQRISSEGLRQWTDNGVELEPLANRSLWDIKAFTLDDGAVVTYFDTPVGDVTNSYVKAIRVDEDGNQVWDTSPAYMCSYLGGKVHLDAEINSHGQVIAAWEDKRIDSSADIYLQNINPDGSLGEYSTSIDELTVGLPGDFTLMNAYPNPFNASTTIGYNLGLAAKVTIEIYDLLGRRVATLIDESRPAGYHQVTWNAADMVSGVYFYKIKADDESRTEKLMLLK